MSENIIKINNLKKSFGNLSVLKNIDFHVDKGEVITIIGSSGSAGGMPLSAGWSFPFLIGRDKKIW